MTAKADRRDMILGRLDALVAEFTVSLAGGEDGPETIAVGSAVHNRDELPKELVPGIILLDADEVKDPRQLQVPGRSLPSGPALMRMTPEIYIVLNVRKPKNMNVGEDLNTARAALINLVTHDETLIEIVGPSGQIIYDGCVTDLARNRTMRGQMGLSFTFVYPFIPNEFLGA